MAFVGFTLLSCKNPLESLLVQTVATPRANPLEGAYNSAQTVTLSCDTSGASIYYTTDDSTPTVNSARYSAPITISATTTLKAIAVKDKMNDSRVLRAVYTINDPSLPTVSQPVASPPEGIYTVAQTVTLTCATSGASIYYSTDDSTPTANSALYSTSITISETTTLKAVAVKAGMNNSAVLTAVYTINDPNKENVETPTASLPEGIYTGAQTVTLTSATSGASIYYTIDGATPTVSSDSYSSPITISETTTLKAVAVKAGMNNSTVLTAVYTINDPQKATVATPTANLAAGTYTGTQTVTLTSATDGVNIYYTTNGANPTVGSHYSYTGPIEISQTTTLKAIAEKSGMNNSAVFTAVYTIDGSQVTSWRGLTVPSATIARQYSSYEGKNDVLHVAPNTSYQWSVLEYNLAANTGHEVIMSVSMEVWLSVSTKVVWQVNNSDYPVIAGSTSAALSAGQWHTVSGTVTLTPEAGKVLYLSKDQLVGNPASVGTPAGNVELYITGFTANIHRQGQGGDPVPPTDARILNPATQTTQLSNPGFALITKPHGGGNKWLIQAQNLGYETWDEDTSGDANFRWFGAGQGGGAAFRAEWGDPVRPKDFLARVGYFWDNENPRKPHTAFGNIYCGFNFTKSGQYRGNFSYIGIYGWSRNPVVEYYIVENSYGNAWNDHAGYIARLNQDTIQGEEMLPYTLDDSEYKVYRKTRTGPSIAGNNTTFTQFFSVRQTPRTSGTISITEHFKEWEEREMNLGTMYECKFKVEIGGTPTQNGGSVTGWFDASFIQFYRANDDGTLIHITQ